jgi:hypothetical protein
MLMRHLRGALAVAAGCSSHRAEEPTVMEAWRLDQVSSRSYRHWDRLQFLSQLELLMGGIVAGVGR